jgi:hypothetical protein
MELLKLYCLVFALKQHETTSQAEFSDGQGLISSASKPNISLISSYASVTYSKYYNLPT